MTMPEQHADFTTRFMPRLRRVARGRFRGRRDGDDLAADLVARGWETYVALATSGRAPSLSEVLEGARGPGRRSDDLMDRCDGLVSLSLPSVRRAAESMPA